MERCSHRFVETYRGPVAFGLSREIDEASLVVYLQKLSDDRLLQLLKDRLSDEEIIQVSDWITNLLRRHLNDEEYHLFFLRNEE